MSTDRSYLTPYAQKLRTNMTPEEIRLWSSFLRKLPVTVRRQKPIGPYIVDFYIAAKKTVIELDGSQHFEETGRTADMERDRFLLNKGITVLRYSNAEVNKSFQAVCEDIMHSLGIDRLEE